MRANDNELKRYLLPAGDLDSEVATRDTLEIDEVTRAEYQLLADVKLEKISDVLYCDNDHRQAYKQLLLQNLTKGLHPTGLRKQLHAYLSLAKFLDLIAYR